MAWYGHRRSGEPRAGARAVVVGLGIAMVGALAIQTSSTVRSGIDASRQSMDGTTASLAGFASGLAGWSFGFGRSQEDEARIAELEAEVRDLHRWKDLAETMALRMERYEKLLDLVGETQGQSVTARVVAEENGPFAASRIANAGAANGVREGFAAINENGLVGRVVRVGEYTSRILLLTDFASRIPVMGTQVGRPRPAGRRQRFERAPARTGNARPDHPRRSLGHLGRRWQDAARRARRHGAQGRRGWRIDLAMDAGAGRFRAPRAAAGFCLARSRARRLAASQKNTDSTLRTVSAPAAALRAAPGRAADAATPAQPLTAPRRPRRAGRRASEDCPGASGCCCLSCSPA